jgi:hypothetical protein
VPTTFGLARIRREPRVNVPQLNKKDYALFPLPNPVHYLHFESPAVANTVAMLRGVKRMNEAIHIRIYITS